VFRNGVSSDGSRAPLVISSLVESNNVDLEDLNGIGVTCKVGRDMDFNVEEPPTAPCRANVLLGGHNICLQFPRLCNVEAMEVIILG